VAKTEQSTLLVTVAVGLAVLIYALDTTVVSTAAPTIVGEFHALGLYGWLFSAYTIPATCTALLYGRLADVFGRKRLFAAVMVGFLLSSVACGLSTSFLMLVIFRAIQGTFAGATFPLAVAIIADVYPIERRAQGFSVVPSTFAFASVLGPTAGGILAAGPGWRWIFWINVPIILLAIGVLWTVYHEGAPRRKATLAEVDLIGSGLLAAGLAALLGGLSAGGLFAGGRPALQIALIVVGIALLGGFVLRERATPTPLLPLRVLSHRGLGGALGTVVLAIWIVFTLLVFIPSLAQGVLGANARDAGLVLIPLMLGWSLTAIVSLRLGQRYGFRTLALVGCLVIAAALVVLSAVGPDSPLAALILPMALAGIGNGMIMPNMQLLSQNSLSDRDQGLAGGLVNTTNTLASSLVAPLLGALEIGRFASNFGRPIADPSLLLSDAGRVQLTAQNGPDFVHQAQVALGAALHDVFLIGFVALALVALWLFFVVPNNEVARRIRLAPLAR
jgi:EmrB/QacA subfamily drug resistance transporter